MSILEELFYASPHFVRHSVINMYGFFLEKWRFSGKYKEYFDLFMKSQWWGIEDIEAYQMKRLKSIIDVAFRKVPYYRNIFLEYGLTPKDFQTVGDLRKIPILTKEMIRNNIHSLLNEDLNKINVVKQYSSGSTGQKLGFYLPKDLAYNINYALLYRFYDWGGVKMGDKRVTIGGRFFTKKAPYWIFNKAENQLLLSIHHLDETTAHSYIKKIQDFAPVFIQGHPTGISFLAERIKDLNEYVRVRAIFSTGETVNAMQRKLIEEAFNTNFYDTYGLSESVISASECQCKNGLHEDSEVGIIEFEKDKGDLYKVIGTSLWNEVMPFIRYEIGDLAKISSNKECPCGRGLPLKIKNVVGRIDDFIKSSDGRIILPVTVRMAVKPQLDLYETYQLQQVGKSEYVFLSSKEFEIRRQHSMEKILKGILGADAQIQYKSNAQILSQGGKVRNVVNLYEKQRIIHGANSDDRASGDNSEI